MYQQAFTDENSIQFENSNFNWLSFNYESVNQDINFINLAPEFFKNNDIFLMNFLRSDPQKTIFENDRQKFTNIESNGNLFGVFMVFSGIITNNLYFYSQDRQYRNIYNNMWNQQVQAEKFQGLIGNNKRTLNEIRY